MNNPHVFLVKVVNLIHNKACGIKVGNTSLTVKGVWSDIVAMILKSNKRKLLFL